MIIEHYSDKYFLDVVKIINNFHKEALGEYEKIIDPESIIDTIIKFKDQNSENVFLLIVNGVCEGILAGFESKSMINPGKIFQELIWYVNPRFRRFGVKMLDIAQNILKERGFSMIIMAVLENSKTEKIKRLYERIGYKPMEMHYMRSLA